MADEREKDLPRELREYIEAVRKTAFAAGYESAKLEAIAVSFGIPTRNVERAERTSGPAVPPKSDEAPASPSIGGEMPRGMTEMYLEQEYRAIAPRTARVVDIAPLIQDRHGIEIPKTTLHRAVKRLGERGILERVGNTTAWRYAGKQGRDSGGGSSDDQSEEIVGNVVSAEKGNGAIPIRPEI